MKGGWKEFRVGNKKVRLGEWERWTLRHLPDHDFALWRHLDHLDLTNRKKLKYIRSIHKLAEKKLLELRHGGPRGGTTVKLTKLGKELKHLLERRDER